MRFIRHCQRMYHQLKIRHKLLGIYLIVTAIPILLVGAYLNFGTRDIVLNNSLSEAEQSVDKLEIRLQTIFNRVTSISDQIYINQNLHRLLTDEYTTPLEVYNAYNDYPVFDDYLQYYDEVEEVRFFMTKNMITDSHFVHADVDIRNQEWYQEAVGKRGKISWVYMQDHWTNDNFLALTRAVYSDNNTLLGVLAIYVSKEMLSSVIEGEPFEAFITLDNEVIVYHQDNHFIGKPPTFLNKWEKGTSNKALFDTAFEGEDVKVNVHSFKPEKSLNNEIQVSAIIPIDEVVRESNVIFTRGFFVVVGALGVSLLLLVIFIRGFHQRINRLRKAMFQVAQGDFAITNRMEGKDEISEVYDELATTSQSIQTLIDEVYIHNIKEEKWRRQQKEMDFKMLSSQINPHFLYNTLEMVRMKALINHDKEVAKIVKMLSKMMRSALERTDKPVPITEEVELVRNYLDIQRLRFGDKFDFSININKNLENYQLFPLLIQPIVENSIIHGIERKEDTSFIEIDIYEKNNYLLIDVKDNGIGISKERLKVVRHRLFDQDYKSDGNRIGLHNVHQRIQLFYGESYGLSIDSVLHEGTVVQLRLPIQPKSRFH
ncbi:cache domain-containing sensor histidine kinase [Saliterribacillus persicus]|uniref:histidine kinase n=1 Tax=Saliterribacillus persicus TaxID=930114 RepID=A0A368Y9A9_9BACI|nr:sensor histidine kinase [Saliterribacillus persicus]RCW74774.1 two-component system sensor histidine kinase YesM [Saliterribacillus persicus]